jgi:hypothetical protein
LCLDQPVQRIIGEGLVTRLITVIRDAVHISVVAIAPVKVITQIENIAPAIYAGGGHSPGAAGCRAAYLKPVGIDKRIRDRRGAAAAADETVKELSGP